MQTLKLYFFTCVLLALAAGCGSKTVAATEPTAAQQGTVPAEPVELAANADADGVAAEAAGVMREILGIVSANTAATTTDCKKTATDLDSWATTHETRLRELGGKVKKQSNSDFDARVNAKLALTEQETQTLQQIFACSQSEPAFVQSLERVEGMISPADEAAATEPAAVAPKTP